MQCFRYKKGFNVKKVLSVIALVATVCAALFFTNNTNKEYKWVVKINGESFSPQQFVTAQLQSCIEAQIFLGEKNVFESNINGMSGEDWINQNSIYLLKKYKYVTDEVKKRNLKFTHSTKKYIESFAKERWSDVESLYTQNGLTEEYYAQYLKSSYEEELLFNALYSEGGEFAVSDKDITEYLNSNLCRIALFCVPKYNEDKTPFTNQKLENLHKNVIDGVKKINSGEDISTIASQLINFAGYDTKNPINITYISSSGINVGSDILKSVLGKLFEIETNECIFYETEDFYYVFQRMELCDTQVEYVCLKQDALFLMKNKEYEELIKDACDNMIVELNQGALKRYSPTQIKMIIR